jgi:hypothetical protein
VGCSDDEEGTPVLDFQPSDDGRCLFVDPGLEAEVSRLPEVPCEDEHTHEIFDVIEWDGSDVFPGLEALDEFAQNRCLVSFEEFVGISLFDSQLAYSWLVPTLDGWNRDEPDRDVICVLGYFDGRTMTGTAEGSGL